MHSETLIIMVKNDNTSRKALYEEAGKYLLDVSKLIFGGVILAGVMNLNVDKLVLFIVGGISVVLSAIVGFVLFKKERSDYGISGIIWSDSCWMRWILIVHRYS